MQNKDKNDIVMLNLDRPRQLWCGHKALKTLTSMTGKSLSEIDMENFNPEDLEPIMYCLLLKDAKENGETLKLEDMEDLLDLAKYSDIMSAMTQALNVAFGDIRPDPNMERIVAKKAGHGKKA